MADSRDIPSGFEALYAGSVDRVYSYARARVGPAEAEDIASEVFTAALVAMRNANEQSITEAWLMAVTRNKVIDRWRASQRRMAKLHLLSPGAPSTSTTEHTDRVTLALDTLSLRYRAVLLLHYLDGHPMTEVADQLGMTLEAARSSIARARKAFRNAYEGAAFDA